MGGVTKVLRDLYSRNIRPSIFGYTINYSGGTPSAGVGGQDLTSITDNGTGDATLNFKTRFPRNTMTFACPGNISGGGWVQWSTATDGGTARLVNVDNSGNPSDSTFHALVLGYASSDVSRTSPQLVRSQRPRTRMLAFQITGATPSLDIGVGAATLTKAGTGDYTLTFKNAFGNTPIALVNGLQTTVVGPRITSISATSVRIQVFNTSSAAADAVIGVVVVGADGRDETPYQSGKDIVECQMRKPRLLGFRCASGGGSLTIGSEHGTIANNGTGDYTITFLEPFRRTPVAIATSGNRAQIKAISSTSVRVFRSNTGGSASDGPLDVLVLGSLDPSEY